MNKKQVVIKPAKPRVYTFKYLTLKEGTEIIGEISDDSLFLSLLRDMVNTPPCAEVTFAIAGTADDVLMALFSVNEESFVIIRDEYSMTKVPVREYRS